MGATTIQDAKLLIQASRVNERINGLKDLVHILKYNRGKSSLDTIGNKAYLALCETLFTCLHNERASYLKAKSKQSKAHAALPLCASALRHVIAAGVRSIKSTTVELIVDTIIEVLPDAQGDLINPLLEDLPKTLRSLLQYQPHVERLSKDCWDAAIDFCVGALATFCASQDTDLDPPQSWSTTVSSRARTPLESTDVISFKASPRPPPVRAKYGNDQLAHAIEEFIHCLFYLVRASNAPVLDKVDQILRVLLQFLQQRTGRSSAAAPALAAINALLKRVTLQSLELTKQTVGDLLPMMKSLWSEPNLREGILIALIYTEPHILSLLAVAENESVASDLEALVETVYNDYRKRQESTAKQFLEEDNLCFRLLELPDRNTHPLHAGAFSLESGKLESGKFQCENLWSTIAMVSHFSFMLDQRRRTIIRQYHDSEENNSKRPRVTELYHEYLRHVLELRTNTKRAALQVVAFMAHEGSLSVDDLQTTLEKLTPCLADENAVHSIWAMIGLAEIALQPSASHPSLTTSWVSAWQSALRAVTSVSTSRAACHLMNVLIKLNIVPFSAISSSVQAMLLSIELSGPALLTETSSALLTTILQERIQENPTNFNLTSERILGWLFSKWTPNLWSERTYSSLHARHYDARDVLQLLFSCLDRTSSLSSPLPLLVFGPIAQAKKYTAEYETLTRYLLLLSDNNPPQRAEKPSQSSLSKPTTENYLTPTETKVIEFCYSEAEKALLRLGEYTIDSSQQITSDMLRIMASLCIIAAALTKLGDSRDHRIMALERTTHKLTEGFADIMRLQKEQYKVDAVLEIVSGSLPDIQSIQELKIETFKYLGIHTLSKHLSKALDERQEGHQSFVKDDDFMEIDENGGSQPAMPSSLVDLDVHRDDLAAASDISALRSSCASTLHLVASLDDEQEDGQNQIPSEFVNYLLSLSESDLLRSRRLLCALWDSKLHMSKIDCLNLLERCSDGLVDPKAREHNSSEVANGMMVEVLIGTALIWGPDPADSDTQDIYENVEQFYAYYAKGMEKGGLRRSPNLQKIFAVFLHGLLKYRPEFGQNRRIPSVRTTLFDLLAKGDMIVKHHIAQRLPRMFEDFVLSEHDKILQDVDSSLPGDDEGIEGIAVRLLVLSQLASTWHTLLRSCVYRIFATAGKVRQASQHARRCISNVAQIRGLESSQSLFRLFASQVVYTWLDRENVFADIPFITFGYATISDLLRDVEPEVTGQAIMRGNKKELAYLAEQLGTTIPELLLANMGKAAAYTIAWDTCNGVSRNKAEINHANLLRDLVSGDKYFETIQKRFPEVLGCIFQSSDHEERIKPSLEKKPAFNDAAKHLTDIMNISHSEQDMTIGMQPAFSAFYLPDQLERLCRRTVEHASTFWSPSCYTFVLRSVLDRIHPALGSLFARSVIRKVRIIVALAGPVACEGYPLQMTLQSLRPFLTDIQCAEDTIGIMQYLLERGAMYLRQQLGFMTGIGLSILISLRVFFGSSQESTTQQSQHVATMTSANKFHAWLSDYLNRHAEAITGVERSSSVKAFRSIITTASQVQAEGNSVRGTSESKLLLEILDDVKSGRRLLTKTSRDVALNLLCQNFQPASMAREDILGLDRDAAQYASLVWDSCQRSNVGNGYLLWSAKVLGRAFNAFGEVKRANNQDKPWTAAPPTSSDSLAKTSHDAIVKEMLNLLYSDIHAEVSLAEGSIRRLLSCLNDVGDSQYSAEIYQTIPDTIGKALGLHVPEGRPKESSHSFDNLRDAIGTTNKKTLSAWIQNLAMTLCQVASDDPVLGSLPSVLSGIDQMAEKLLPYIVHLVLLIEFDSERRVRDCLSTGMSTAFRNCDDSTAPFVHVFLHAVLYLRSQPVPQEATRTDRDRWLEIDYLEASRAANSCGMYRSALLFAETFSGQPARKASTRRSSTIVESNQIPITLQLSIYKNLDEPDSFYGIEREPTLLSVTDRLEYEGDGIKSLLFRGARLDSQMRRSNGLDSADCQGTIKSLIMVNMNSVTNSLLSNDQFRELGDNAVDSTLYTARKLNQWDVKAPEINHSESSTLFKAFQSLHFAKDAVEARVHFERQLLTTMDFLTERNSSTVPVKIRIRTLGALTDADEVIRAERSEHLLDTWDRMKAREHWMRAGEFNDVRQLLSCRESLFSVLGANSSLLKSLRVMTGTIRHMESESLISSSRISRRHGALPEALASVTYLADIVPECKSVGLDIEAVATHEVANVLWEQGEAETSIRMRQHLIKHATFDSQDTNLSLPVLLARLGHHLAEARLAKPSDIILEYLEPAIRELRGQKHGVGPGQVFHEFALFCDKQIQSVEAAEDMERIKTVMDRKLQEYHEFIKLSKTDKSKGMRDVYHRNARRAKGWYDLDNAEYERLRRSREQFLRQCLENYLLSLAASDEYNNDALRVFSLWLEYAETELANEAVESNLRNVPSRKFALLMNQLSSRLQSEETKFQRLLVELVFRICVDHPFHGMHQIFAIQLKVGAITREDAVRAKDESARSRQKAAVGVANALGNDKRARAYWSSIFQSNEIYHYLAMFKGEKESTQQGRELPLDRYKESKDLVNKVPKLNVPPATLQIEVRPNMNYTDLPRIERFKPKMTIANGLSAPKIITAMGTDGKPYKQLFKSGSDDLRQDAIMEQVFDQVSRLLKNHTATRVRHLGIRTYKVLPLSTRSGLMEFVPNTIPLHLWVMPAHEKYYPSDYKPDRCRKEIGACQQDSLNTRIRTWQKIAEKFHPVLRYFLLERFEDPDEWFERRLAYTRSTAAISILGHVLGLGDRHCHNILLDEKSGEVVHIDLGVSFEAGRVLPVPEVVPFRLTRDLVDAMGYTKTEGVFRRCCEFTLDTLREERESIMTLLNVLRYDPLVNWSITPTKAKRMQEGNQDTNAQNGGRAGTVGPGGTPAPSTAASGAMQVEDVVPESNRKKEGEDQAGEAGRALSVVEKKLSKTLSTRAMVNELIQQATDEKNLAVLYMGWASYA